MANYPTSADNLASNKSNGTSTVTDHPNHHNAMADSINAIEAELGLDPSGSSYSTVRARLDAMGTDPGTITANFQSLSGGAGYTLVLSDAGKVVEISSSSTANVAIPLFASVAFATGTVIEVFRYGTGAVSIVQGGGVTIISPGGLVALQNRYSSVSLRKRATNEWALSGDLA